MGVTVVQCRISSRTFSKSKLLAPRLLPLMAMDSSALQDQLKNMQQIQASQAAFAAILSDGSVVTWGDAELGGDSSAVQDRLKNVQLIQASQAAFAAILSDGSVVTWGKP